MDIRYFDRNIARVDNVRITGRPGVGAHVLEVGFTLNVHALPKATAAPTIIGYSGKLSVKSQQVAQLARRPTYVSVSESGSYSRDLATTALVSPSQLRALEMLREGPEGVLKVHVTLNFEIFCPAEHRDSSTSTTIELSSSDWRKLLAAARFEDRATIEIPVLGGRVRPPYDKAAEHMREALKQLEMRQWWPAVVACRKVLEELKRHAGSQPPSWKEWSDKDTREGWGTAERLLVARQAVHHLGHQSAHATDDVPVQEHEARLMVALTGSYLRYYADAREPT